jgi:uroporphyrin-III C-methyltransferase / precorrin-2 dehydrogenase / sirohydrochlorin ferrochelatase
MHSLPIFVRLAGRPVILIGEGDAADAKRRILERAGAEIRDEAADAVLAIVAVEDEAEAEANVTRLRERGILVNAVDRPHLCDFTLPAIVDRNPVLIAIGTGGASAGLAKGLRQRLEALLPAALGTLAEGLAKAKAAMRARWPDAGERRRAIDAALSEGGALDPLRGAYAVEDWVASGSAAAASQARTIVLASDDPDQLTLEAARLLGQADTVVYDAGIAPAILDRARADARRFGASDAGASYPGLTVRLVREKGL